MKLSAPQTYAHQAWQIILGQLGSTLDDAFMKGQDVRLQRSERLILTDLDTGDLYAVTIRTGAVVLDGPL